LELDDCFPIESHPWGEYSDHAPVLARFTH
jgi:hypothetical protein